MRPHMHVTGTACLHARLSVGHGCPGWQRKGHGCPQRVSGRLQRAQQLAGAASDSPGPERATIDAAVTGVWTSGCLGSWQGPPWHVRRHLWTPHESGLAHSLPHDTSWMWQGTVLRAPWPPTQGRCTRTVHGGQFASEWQLCMTGCWVHACSLLHGMLHKGGGVPHGTGGRITALPQRHDTSWKSARMQRSQWPLWHSISQLWCPQRRRLPHTSVHRCAGSSGPFPGQQRLLHWWRPHDRIELHTRAQGGAVSGSPAARSAQRTSALVDPHAHVATRLSSQGGHGPSWHRALHVWSGPSPVSHARGRPQTPPHFGTGSVHDIRGFARRTSSETEPHGHV
eukprot:Opistho-1_new@84166